ncbi:MAG: PAS domain S-box protein [Gemmataceae bacterium]
MGRSASANEFGQRVPRRVSLIYFLFGVTWIFVTDGALAGLDLPTDHWLLVAWGKGTLFVALSAFLIYFIVQRSIHSLRRTNSLIRAIINETTDSVYVKDKEGRYLLVNEAAARLTGKLVTEILGQTDRDLLAADDAFRVMQQDRRVLQNGNAETDELALTISGVNRTFLTVKAPYRDEGGNILGLIGVSRDITERKEAERLIQTSEEFVREVLDSIPAHLAVLDKSGSIVSVNQRWLAFSNENSNVSTPAPHTGVGTNYLGICDESAAKGCEDARTVADGIRVILSGSNTTFEFEYPCPSPSTPRWFLLSAVPLGAGTRGVVISHTDITARKLAELQAQENEERYRLLFNFANDAMFVCDGVRFLDCNHRAVELFGWSREQLLTMGPPDLSPMMQPNGEPSAPRREKHIADALAGQPSLYHWHHVHANGAALETEVSLNSVVIRGQRLIQAVVRDVTERVAAQRAIARLATFPEHNPNVVIDADANGELRYANPSAKRVFPDLVENCKGHPVLVAAARVATNIPPGEVMSQPEEFVWGERSYVGTVLRLAEDQGVRFYLTDVTPLHQAQAALAQSEMRFRALIENAADITVAFTPEGQFIYVSPSVRQFGYCPADLVGRSVFEQIHEDDRPAALAAIGRALQSHGDEQRLQLRYNRRDGTWAIVEASGRFVPGLFASPGTVVINARDVTDRVWAEEARNQVAQALEESEARFRAFLDHCPAATWMIGADGRAVFANRRLEAMLNRPPGSLLGLTVDDIMPAELARRYQEQNERVLSEGRPIQLEEDYLKPDGTLGSAIIIKFPLPSPSGEKQLGGFALDITETREAQKRLRVLGTAIESSPNAVFITDRNGTIQWVNSGFTRMSGFPYDEAVGKNPRLLNSGQQNAAFYRTLWETILAGRSWSGEVVDRHKDGTEYVVHQTVTPLTGTDGKVSQFVAVQEDITASKRAEARLRNLAVSDTLTGLLNR